MSLPGMRILIIGAGVGGLTLALLLRRGGMVAEVVEQAPELREAGAAIALASNATRVLQHLGLGDELARLSTEPTKVIHRDGHPISTHPIGERYRSAFGAPFYGLHRAAFQQLLAGVWGPGTCTWAAGWTPSRSAARPSGSAAPPAPLSTPTW